jgi:hypothetical protein
MTSESCKLKAFKWMLLFLLIVSGLYLCTQYAAIPAPSLTSDTVTTHLREPFHLVYKTFGDIRKDKAKKQELTEAVVSLNEIKKTDDLQGYFDYYVIALPLIAASPNHRDPFIDAISAYINSSSSINEDVKGTLAELISPCGNANDRNGLVKSILDASHKDPVKRALTRIFYSLISSNDEFW